MRPWQLAWRQTWIRKSTFRTSRARISYKNTVCWEKSLSYFSNLLDIHNKLAVHLMGMSGDRIVGIRGATRLGDQSLADLHDPFPGANVSATEADRASDGCVIDGCWLLRHFEGEEPPGLPDLTIIKQILELYAGFDQ